MRKIFLICLIVATALSSEAQKSKKDKREEKRQRINALVKQEEEGVITYRKHTAGGVKLVSDGYGAFIEISRAQSIRRSLLYQLEITERKHPKEEKQSSIIASTTPFIYGKHNFFYPVKIGVQQQLLLGNKSNKNGVSVSGNGGGGICIGLLRPYYVQVVTSSSTAEFVKYDSPDSSMFLSQNVIGGPGFGRGWGELKVVPGAYLKTALRFDYGRYNEMISALEVGLSGEFYSKKIPQIVYAKEKQFFMSAYIAVVFGRRK